MQNNSIDSVGETNEQAFDLSLRGWFSWPVVEADVEEDAEEVHEHLTRPGMYCWMPPKVVQIAIWSVGYWYLPFMATVLGVSRSILSASGALLVEKPSHLSNYLSDYFGVLEGAMLLFAFFAIKNRWFRRHAASMIIFWLCGCYLYLMTSNIHF
ncbi:hypothetical protein BH11CYA1_BH11CYA1_26600 [soil metagenome]